MTAARDEVWARSAGARLVRDVVLRSVFAPLVAGHARVEVFGAAQVEAIVGPAVFVANHASHVDTPILLCALPSQRRRRTLVAAAADYFFTRRPLAVGVSLAFGAVPVARRGGDDGGALAPLARLVGEGFSLVVFAEGTRSRTGRFGQFRPGAAALAGRCGVPLVPVHLAGTAPLMGPGHAWMVRADPAHRRRRHAVTVAFGAPLAPGAGEDVEGAMDEVRRFMVAPA